MTWLKTMLSRLRALWYAEKIHYEIDEELRFHVDMRTEDNIRRGMTPDEARRDAERRFGNSTLIKEQGYKVRGGGWIETLWQDTRYGVRMLRKNPSFTLVAVFTLALGIGANTAIFSVVNAVLLKPLPYRDPERIMQVSKTNLKQQNNPRPVSIPDFLDWRTQNRSFEQMAAYIFITFVLTGNAEPERITGAKVSASLLPLLGVELLAGRAFVMEEDRFESEPVVIIGDGLWERRFNRDPNVIGQPLVLNNRSHTVVGIMPRSFDFPQGAEMWTPDILDPQEARRDNNFLNVIARLKPDVTAAQAQADMEVFARRLAEQYPETNRDRSASVTPLQEVIVGKTRPTLLILFGRSVSFY